MRDSGINGSSLFAQCHYILFTMTNEVQSFILRCVSTVGALTVKKAEDLLRKYHEDEISNVIDVVKEINEIIKPYQQTIKILTDEITDEQILMFINFYSVNVSEDARNSYSVIELEYYRVLIQEIMTTEKRRISSAYALSLADKVQSKFGGTSPQELLDVWCHMRYLDIIGEEYTVGIRAIHEFESYFLESMPDLIKDCVLCKEIVFQGQKCQHCGVAVHKQCLLKYVTRVAKWPCCKQAFDSRKLEAWKGTRESNAEVSLTK